MKKYTIELNSRQAVVLRVLLKREMASRQLRPPWKGVYATAEEVLHMLQGDANVTEEPLPEGLCGNREDHGPHVHNSTSLGRFWCHADQARRLPFAMERRDR